MSTPRCLVLAGPNGAGKSTLYTRLGAPGMFINADMVAARLNPADPQKSVIAAGRLVIEELDAAISKKQDFTYETTLSSRQSLTVLERARGAGFEVALAFIVLDSAELHINRVGQRVSQGGHHIDEVTIRRRYDTCFRNLPFALHHSDAVVIFDNSGVAGAERKLEMQAGTVVFNALKTTSALDRRIAAAVGIETL